MPRPLYFFLLVSVIIMICKSHFGEHFTTVKLSVCFIGTVTSLRQEWCSLPVWHQVEGLCLATDNNSVPIAIIFLFFFSFPSAPGCPNFPAGFWKMEAHFWTRYGSDGWNFSCHAKSHLTGWELVLQELTHPKGFSVYLYQAGCPCRAERFETEMLIATLRLQR